MKLVKTVFFVLLLSLLSACATTSYVDKPATIEAKPGKALIVFYRESRFVGSAGSFSVFEDSVKLGALKNGSFFTVDAEPGEHVYTAKTEVTETIALDVKAGRKYYVRGSFGVGILVGRPELREVSESEAMMHIPKLKYTVFTPAK